MWGARNPGLHEFIGTKATQKNSGPGHWESFTACDPRALGGAQCGEQRGPDFEQPRTMFRGATFARVRTLLHGERKTKKNHMKIKKEAQPVFEVIMEVCRVWVHVEESRAEWHDDTI